MYAAGFSIDASQPATGLFPWLHAPVLLLWLGAIAWVWRRPGLPVLPIVAFATLFRLLAAAEAPLLSSDVYRYAWDARVQHTGFSPYAYPPGDPALSDLRDGAVHPNINRPTERTVYPPGAQLFFRLLPEGIDGIRLVLIALDLLTMLLLVRLLRVLGKDPAQVIVYAWAPLVVYEVGNGGHLEAAMLPLLVGAALAHHAGRLRTSGLLLGAATAMKLYPGLAGVALGRPRLWRVALPAVAVVAAAYALYAPGAGGHVLGFLPRYVGSAEDHNIGVRAWLEALLGVRREVAFGLCLALLGAGTWLIDRAGGPLEQRLLRLIGLYLLTLPTALHPWYALWLVPWLCITPHPAWLWLLGALPLSYLKYATPGGVMPPWVVPVELLPVLALLAVPYLGPSSPLQALRLRVSRSR